MAGLRTRFLTVCAFVAAVGAACTSSGTGGAATEPATAASTTTTATTVVAPDTLHDANLWRSADADVVALVDTFIAAANAGRDAVSIYLDAGYTSWAASPWLRPSLGEGTRVTRLGQVRQIGTLQPTNNPGVQPTPFLVAFHVDMGGFAAFWIEEWSSDGTHVLHIWAP